MGTDSLFNKGAETTRYLCKRMNLDPSLTYIPKLAITELLEENREISPHPHIMQRSLG